MRYLIAISLLYTSACGTFQIPKDPRTIHGVNPVFQPYLELYLQAKGRPLNYDIPIQFGKMPDDDTAAICTYWHNPEYRQITIDEEYWNNYTNEKEKIGLIFHELGHCDLNRDHDNRLINHIPRSLMYYQNFSYNFNLQAYYFSEIFNPSESLNSYQTTEEGTSIRCHK